MTRRQLMGFLSSLGLASQAGANTTANTTAQAGGKAGMPGSANGPEPLRLTEAQWRERLDAAQFRVLRQEGTERAGSSPLNHEKRAGTYHCAGCELPLFSSAAKYDSGTGWPSFHTPLPGALGTKTDYKLLMPRTEYHCARCEGHQGHVFPDGPKPSGKRYCNNGVALRFVAAAA